MTSTETTINCPTCSKPVKWDAESPYRPFCCRRCQQIDFGDWAKETFSIPMEKPPSYPEDGGFDH